MPDNIAVTPGSGASVRSKLISGVQTQVVQIDLGGESAELLLIADATYGVPVDIKRFPAGAVLVNNPTAANLKVDASGATVPISAASAIPVSAGNPAPVAVRIANGSSAWIDTLPVSGTVTVNQGTASNTAGSWPTIITDGTNVAQVDSSTHGLKVLVVGGGGGGVSIADGGTFVESSTSLNVIGGEYNTSAAAVTSGKAGAVQITQNRGLHVSLRAAAGTEIGSAAAPLRIDPTGSTIQPVSGTVTVNLKDNAGTAYSATNPLYVSRGGRGQVRVSNSVALSASQTAQAIWTPGSGKKFYMTRATLVVTTAGPLKFFDGTDASANRLADSGSGNWPTGVFSFTFDEPWPSATANNVFEYTSGSGLVGVMTTHGFEV